MNELITIQTGGQGCPVVSARDLYAFLGFDGSQWSRWSKKNIVGNRFAKEGDDWEGFDIMSSSKNGSMTTDYALTLDFAKRLSMLARTEKGEEIRRYFITKEEELRQRPAAPAPLLTTEQMLVQLLASQQEQLNQLRVDVKQIIEREDHKPGGRSALNPSPGKQLNVPGTAVPPHRSRFGTRTRCKFGDLSDTGDVTPALSLRETINHRVSEYSGVWGTSTSETYNYLYKRLNDVYCINVYRLKRGHGETFIDALERYGHLDRLYSLICAELNYNPGE